METDGFPKAAVLAEILESLPEGECLTVKEIAYDRRILVEEVRVNRMLTFDSLFRFVREGKVALPNTHKNGRKPNWYLMMCDENLQHMVPIKGDEPYSKNAVMVAGSAMADATEKFNVVQLKLARRLKGSPKKNDRLLTELGETFKSTAEIAASAVGWQKLALERKKEARLSKERADALEKQIRLQSNPRQKLIAEEYNGK